MERIGHLHLIIKWNPRRDEGRVSFDSYLQMARRAALGDAPLLFRALNGLSTIPLAAWFCVAGFPQNVGTVQPTRVLATLRAAALNKSA